MLKPFWQNIFRSDVLFGLVMILLLGIPRFILVLNANVTGNYNLISLIFLFMWISPFIFLTRSGRSQIGMTKPTNATWLLYSFLSGIIFCVLIYIVAVILFGHSISNWFVYISNSYQVADPGLSADDRTGYFIIYSIIGMTFSPVGEELFYRGIVHESFKKKWGDNKASYIDSLAFALTHLAHFGIVYVSGAWRFLFVPAILWVLFMFLASRIFFYCRQKTGSIAGAVMSHAGFNFAMMYVIFYYVLDVNNP